MIWKVFEIVTSILIILVNLGCGTSIPPSLGTSESPKGSESIVGEYYQGDGLGMNINLDLKKDSSYECEWHGCRGKYGDAKGFWKISDSILILVPSEESGALTNYLRSLKIRKHLGNWFFIRDDKFDSESFLKYGVSRHTCLQNKDHIFE